VVGNFAQHFMESVMSESNLASFIEQLGEEAAAVAGFNAEAYAIEFSRRVDRWFPVTHEQRAEALRLAMSCGYLFADRSGGTA
jgi:hypothetical protein